MSWEGPGAETGRLAPELDLATAAGDWAANRAWAPPGPSWRRVPGASTRRRAGTT